MEERRRFDASVVAWWLAIAGAVALILSTVEPTRSIQQLLIVGCVLAALGAVLYGLDRLRSRRHD